MQQTFLKMFKTPKFRDSIGEELGKAMTELASKALAGRGMSVEGNSTRN